MRFSYILLITFYLMTVASARGQSEPVFNDSARSEFRAATAALVALATDDSLSSARYKLKNDEPGSDDADLDLVKLIGEFPLGDSERQFVPLLQISPAYLKVDQDGSDGSKLEIDAWSLGFGAGLQSRFFEGMLEVIPRFKFEYSEVEFDPTVSGADDDIIDSILPDVDAWTYIPSLEIMGKRQISEDHTILSLGTKISFVYIRADSSNLNVDDFSDESWVWKNRLTLEHGVSAGQGVGELFLRPLIGRIDLHGAARDGLELNHFYELGMEVLSRSWLSDIFSEIGFASVYIYEEDIQGWRFGFFGSLS